MSEVQSSCVEHDFQWIALDVASDTENITFPNGRSVIRTTNKQVIALVCSKCGEVRNVTQQVIPDSNACCQMPCTCEQVVAGENPPTVNPSGQVAVNWTTSSPTEVGVYLWWSQPGYFHTLRAVPRYDGKLIGQNMFEERPTHQIPLSEIGGRWFGPLKDPEKFEGRQPGLDQPTS